MRWIIDNCKWFSAFIKRLLKKPSFLITLLIIPIVTIAMSVVSDKEKSGIINVALASRDCDNPIYSEMVNELLSETSSMHYYVCESPDNAVDDVHSGKANCAWIFSDNYAQNMRRFAGGDQSAKLCEVILKEDSVLYQLSHEKLYSLIYKHLSYDIFVDFMNRKDLDSEYCNEEEYRKYFEQQKELLNEEIVNFVFLDAPEKTLDDVNHITSPLRGLLAVAVLISCLASMMYSLEDENNGKYGMFPISRRLSLHILSVSSASLLVCLAMFCSLYYSGLLRDLLYELILLFLYATMTVGFCVFIGIICKKTYRLCIAFPVLTVAAISLCPVFVNTAKYQFFKTLLPTYHYLTAINDAGKIKHMIVYIVVILVLNTAVYHLLNKE